MRSTELQTVYVVDDDVSVRSSLQWLFESVHIPVVTFDSGTAFLAAYSGEEAGCIVLDVRMPGMSGIEVMKRLRRLRNQAPIVLLSAHGDVPMAVQALKDGAFDFLEKPYNNQRLLDCVQQALEQNAIERVRYCIDNDISERLASLTQRELDIINLIVAGKSNKEIGRELDISYKTVESHRSKIMVKMGAGSVVDLVRLVSTHYASHQSEGK